MRAQRIYNSIAIVVTGVGLIATGFFLLNITRSSFWFFKGEIPPEISPGEFHVEGLTVPKQNIAGDFFINKMDITVSYPQKINIGNSGTVTLKYESIIYILDDSTPDFNAVSLQPIVYRKEMISNVLTSQQVKGRIRRKIPPNMGPKLDSTTKITIRPSQKLHFLQEKSTPITYQWYIAPKKTGNHYLLLDVLQLYNLDKSDKSDLKITLNKGEASIDTLGIIKMPFSVYTIYSVSRRTVEIVKVIVFALGGIFLVFGISRMKLMEIIMGNTGDTYNVGAPVGAVGKEANANVSGIVGTAQSGSHQEFTQHNYVPEQKQTLAEAAEEIQNLLKQLEQTNPTATVEQQKAYVDAAISPSIKQRCVGALKAGGETAIEEFLDNPYVNVGKAVVEGWLKPE